MFWALFKALYAHWLTITIPLGKPSIIHTVHRGKLSPCIRCLSVKEEMVPRPSESVVSSSGTQHGHGSGICFYTPTSQADAPDRTPQPIPVGTVACSLPHSWPLCFLDLSCHSWNCALRKALGPSSAVNLEIYTKWFRCHLKGDSSTQSLIWKNEKFHMSKTKQSHL